MFRVETTSKGVILQFDKTTKQQVIPWDKLPRFLVVMNSIARQRKEDLEAIARAADEEAKLLGC